MGRLASSRQALHRMASSFSSCRSLPGCPASRSFPRPNPCANSYASAPAGSMLSMLHCRGLSPNGSRSFSTDGSQPQPTSSNATFNDLDSDMYQQNSSIRRRPYNIEAKMRMKQYRREASHRQRALEIEEEERNFQLDYSKMYKKGDPGTVQGVVKEINTVGYFMKLPNGREGFLPCSQLDCMGGIPLLSRLFKVGDEITVRAEIVGDGGKDRLYCKA